MYQSDQNHFKQNPFLIETEIQLLKNSNKIDLSLYEKNTMNKVNFISYLGVNYICSCLDKYKKIRIPIISVFLKILSKRTVQNNNRLNKIKQLIYSSKLGGIVHGKVITTNQLFTNFGIIINSLQYDRTENIENWFIKKINSEPFFDKTIMEAFYEKFSQNNQQSQLTSNISKWIKNELQITVIFSKKDYEEQSNGTIILRKNDKNQVIKKFSSFNICSMVSIDEKVIHQTPTKVQKNLNRPPQLQTQQLLNSISSIDSPIRRMSQHTKNNEVYLSISVQNSLQFQPRSHQQLGNKQNQEPNLISLSRPKPYNNDNEKGFWKICCCGRD